jgi:hypothetical protein
MVVHKPSIVRSAAVSDQCLELGEGVLALRGLLAASLQGSDRTSAGSCNLMTGNWLRRIGAVAAFAAPRHPDLQRAMLVNSRTSREGSFSTSRSVMITDRSPAFSSSHSTTRCARRSAIQAL